MSASKLTAREHRRLWLNLATGRLEKKTAKHRRNARARRLKNRAARLSRRINR